MEKYLISCKRTDKDTISIRLVDWVEIAHDALSQGKIPVMAIEIGGRKLWIFEDQYVEVDDDTGKLCVTEG